MLAKDYAFPEIIKIVLMAFSLFVEISTIVYFNSLFSPRLCLRVGFWRGGEDLFFFFKLRTL
jgi:hypothetical protein